MKKNPCEFNGARLDNVPNLNIRHKFQIPIKCWKNIVNGNGAAGKNFLEKYTTIDLTWGERINIILDSRTENPDSNLLVPTKKLK